MNTVQIMKKTIIAFVLIFSALVTFAFNKTIDSVADEQARQLMQQQPVQFIENKGQMADDKGNPVPFVLYNTSFGSTNIFITETGLTYVFLEKIKAKENDGKAEKNEEEMKKPSDFKYSRVDVRLDGGKIDRNNISASQAGETDLNFFYPHCSQGIYGVKEYKKIIIRDVYPGIDWVWYSNEKGLKYDFIVHPGASPERIKLIYKWADLQVKERGKILQI